MKKDSRKTSAATVAVMKDNGVLGPYWECELCGRVYAFQSVMISHLMMDHALRVTISDNTILCTNVFDF